MNAVDKHTSENRLINTNNIEIEHMSTVRVLIPPLSLMPRDWTYPNWMTWMIRNPCPSYPNIYPPAPLF